MCWCLRTSLPTSSFTAHTGRPMSLEHSSLACEYISGTLKLGKWVYNIYIISGTLMFGSEFVSGMLKFGKWVYLWNVQVWQVSMSWDWECSHLASEFVSGMLEFGKYVSEMLKFGKWICLGNAQVWQVHLWTVQVWQVSMAWKHSSLAHEWVDHLNVQVWQVTIILLPMM